MAKLGVRQLNLGAIDRLRLGWRLLRDPRIPAWPKWLAPAAMILYVLSPLDAIPDFIPILGQLDDLSIIALTLAVVAMLVRWSPGEIVAEHAEDLGVVWAAPVEPPRWPLEREEGPMARSAESRRPVEATYWVDEWR